MNFQEELQHILSSVEGAQTALLMGFDGIPVAEKKIAENAPSITEPVVEYAQLLKEASKVAQGNQLGHLKEVVFHFGEQTLLFRMLTPSYFVVILLSRDSFVGKGRFALRKKSPAFEKEL